MNYIQSDITRSYKNACFIHSCVLNKYNMYLKMHLHKVNCTEYCKERQEISQIHCECKLIRCSVNGLV